MYLQSRIGTRKHRQAFGKPGRQKANALAAAVLNQSAAAERVMRDRRRGPVFASIRELFRTNGSAT